MKLYFTIVSADCIKNLYEYLETHEYSYATLLGSDKDGVYELDTYEETCISGIKEVVDSFIYHISNTSDLLNFIDVADGRVLARFNEGKTEYSLIDFSLWKSIFNDEDINMAQQSAEHMLIELVLETSKVCHSDISIESLDRIRLLSYNTAVEYGFGASVSESLDFEVFEPMAQVLMYGAKKYDRDNWKKTPAGNTVCNIVDSLLRHIIALQNGEEFDKESKIHHIGHVMCNVMFLSHHINK